MAGSETELKSIPRTLAVASLLSWRLGSGVWIGTLGFFSLVVTPIVFQVLGIAHAAPVIDRLFPQYYATTLWLGGFAIAGAATLWMQRRIRRSTMALALIAYGLDWLARLVLAMMQGRASGGAAFSVLHQVSVFLNLLETAALLTAIVFDAVTAHVSRVS